MPQQKIITIPKPCSENWENMSLTQKGRHCFSCEKEVVDFTRFSDQELLQYFSQPKTNEQKICGRFNQTQLHPISVETAKPFRTNVLWQQFLYLLVTLIYPAITSCQSNKTTTKGKVKTTVTTEQIQPQVRNCVVPEDIDNQKIQGEVVEIKPKQSEPEIMGKIMVQPPVQQPKPSIAPKHDRPSDGRKRPIKLPNKPKSEVIMGDTIMMGDPIIRESK